MTDKQPVKKDHEKLVNALFNVGGAWARYGLGLGRAALETSAVTLRNTATALGEISDAIERRAREREEDTLDDSNVVEAPRS